MRGEQDVLARPSLPEYLYLGGAPSDIILTDSPAGAGGGSGGDLFVPRSGLRGCIKHFLLDQDEVNLFADALAGQDIIECDSAVCALSPCANGGVCNQDPTGSAWFCECPPGYTGPLCERTVCQANPCLHGGTCFGKTRGGDGFICLCPYGKHGDL